MEDTSFSGAMLAWQCPKRALGSQIPLDVYLQIFAWLKPVADPDSDIEIYNTTLARLALVCRYFAYYATREFWRYLDLNGNKNLRRRMPAEPWCDAILTQLQPAETLRTDVKECKIRSWKTSKIPNFARILPRLDNLTALKLWDVDCSHLLFQCIGRLRTLEQLELIQLNLKGNPKKTHSKEHMFSLHEMAFPALRQLTIGHMHEDDYGLVEDAICVLGAVITLQSLVIDDPHLLHRFLPHAPQLVSLSGDFSRIGTNEFIGFIKGHAALQDLTMYFCTLSDQRFYLNVDIEPDVLPGLRSFSGPLALASKLLCGRPIGRLSLDCNSSIQENLRASLPYKCGLTMFPHIDSGTWGNRHKDIGSNREVREGLKNTGGSIHQLFVSMEAAIWGTDLGLCFPNIVSLHLDVELWGNSRVTDERLRNIGQVIGHLKSLESLILSFQGQRFDSCSLSPGYQHHFVHHEYQECCPTLRTVVFGSFMAWHLPAESEECHCGLELLSSRMICQNLRRLKKMRNPDPVFDWEGKLACLLSEGPLGLSEKDIKRIIKPSSKSSCSVCPDN